MTIDEIDQFVKEYYEVQEWRHATAILSQDFPNEWADIVSILKSFRLRKSWITVGGGQKSPIARALDTAFSQREWSEKSFDTTISIDGMTRKSPTHAVDYYKNKIAIETEWNNKNPFYDRDLNNFRLLFDLHVITVHSLKTF